MMGHVYTVIRMRDLSKMKENVDTALILSIYYHQALVKIAHHLQDNKMMEEVVVLINVKRRKNSLTLGYVRTVVKERLHHVMGCHVFEI